MKNFLISAAAFGIAISIVYGGGKLLKMAHVPMPFTVSGFAVSAAWAGMYRSISEPSQK